MSLGSDVPHWLRVYLELEESATHLRAHLPYVVYGLFQTPDYASAIARSVGVTPKDDEYVERTVRLRKARQRRIHRGRVSVAVVRPCVSEVSRSCRIRTEKSRQYIWRVYDGEQLIETGDEIRHFVESFDQAQSLALDPHESQRFVQRISKEWEMKDD